MTAICQRRPLSTFLISGLLLLASSLTSDISRAATPTAPSRARRTAVQPPPQPVINEQDAAPESPWKGFGIGVIAGYIDYKEPGLMRQYGEMYGLGVSYFTLKESNSLAINAEGEIMAGRLIYDGGSVTFNSNGTTTTTRSTAGATDYIYNARMTVGLFRALSPDWSGTPFIGIGYRDLNDKIDGTGSYNRNISYIYVPIGGQVSGWVGSKTSLSLTADFDLVLLGTVISKFSDINSSNPDLTNYNRGTGFHIAAKLKHDFGTWSGHLQPYYQKWMMNQSNGVDVQVQNGNTIQTATFYEPENQSDFIGCNIGMDF